MSDHFAFLLPSCQTLGLEVFIKHVKCKTADTFEPCKLFLWNTLLLSNSHEYIFFATALIFVPLKPLCWLCVFSGTKKTKPFLGNERLDSLM